jgi:hypothetical protein
VAEDELALIDEPEFWGKRGQCRVEALRLPGTGAELSRRFGIEVQTTPFVHNVQPFELSAGLRARLLLEGGRLWRSTVVTLGGQRADQITVLPDMNAIVAEFNCVETPSSARGGPPNAGQQAQSASDINGTLYPGVPVRVWTSEGVADGGYGADIFVPSTFKGCGVPEAAPAAPVAR